MRQNLTTTEISRAPHHLPVGTLFQKTFFLLFQSIKNVCWKLWQTNSTKFQKQLLSWVLIF